MREALLAKWFKKSGDVVKRDEPLCEIETDKITLDLNADASGVLTISVSEGTTVKVGTTIGVIEESAVLPEAPVTASATAPAETLAAPSSSPSLRREMREHNISPDEVAGSGKEGRITLDDLFTRIEEKSKIPPPPGLPLLSNQPRSCLSSKACLLLRFSRASQSHLFHPL